MPINDGLAMQFVVFLFMGLFILQGFWGIYSCFLTLFKLCFYLLSKRYFNSKLSTIQN